MKSQPELHAKIYLINLNRDTGRLALMTEQLNRLGLPFERFPAIHGVDMPEWLRPYFLSANGSIASDLRLGEVGCYASHLAVMARIAESNQPALILEDDLEFDSDFPEILRSIHALPKDWDIVRLSNPKRRTVTVGRLCAGRDVVKYSRIPTTTGACLVASAGARKFLDWKIRRDAPYDHDVRRVWDCGLTTYGVLPPSVRHPAGGKSTITAMDETGPGRAFVKTPSLAELLRQFAYTLRWLGPINYIRAKL